MKAWVIGIILSTGMLMMSCGLQSHGETDSNTQKESQRPGDISEKTSQSQWEEVGTSSRKFIITAEANGNFYYAEATSGIPIVYLFDSTEKQIGKIEIKKKYNVEAIEEKNGRILLFAQHEEKEKALLYHYSIATKTAKEYKIPHTLYDYIVYKNSIYFCMEQDGKIIKTDLKGNIEKTIQLPDREFKLELIYRDRIYIQGYVYPDSEHFYGYIYSVNLDGSDKKKYNFGKEFKNKFAIQFDASNGYVYMIVTTDIFDKQELYRFALESNKLERVSKNDTVGTYVIGEENIFYVPEESAEIYSINKNTGEEKLFSQDGYTDGKELFLIASRDSLVMQTYGISDGSIMVVPQNYKKGSKRLIRRNEELE